MNYPLIILGLVFILIGSFIAGIGWNWDKIKGKSQSNHPNTVMQASSVGDQSPAFNIQQNNYYSESKDSNISAPEKKSQSQPIQNFASKYTLAADMNIQQGNIHVNGINVRGNVNVNNTEGVELKNMQIFNANEYSKGKINIDRSQEFSVKDNSVSNEINVDRSKSFEVAKNTVGRGADLDKKAQDSMNIILTDSSNLPEVLTNLLIIQDLIKDDNRLANALGQRIETLDKESKGRYKDVVLKHLRQLNAEMLQKAETLDIGRVFHWLNFFLHFDVK